MAEKDPRAIQAALGAPFAPEDLEWRLQTTMEDKMRGLAVPYVTNRAIQSRLDDVVGPENWHNEYKPWHSADKKEAQICGIAIYFEDRGWVQKWDGAEDSDIEPIKGGLSDSMKRAAVQWGIGRVLYNMDTVWVDVEKRGRSFVIKGSERPKLNKAYLGMLDGLHLLPGAATGTQAQLTSTAPKPEHEAPKAAKQPPADKPTESQTPFPSMQAEYTVQSITVQKGMSSVSTSLTLLDKHEKKVQVFARGKLEDIYSGAQLCKVKLVQRQQNNVVFYVLEGYEVMKPAQRAA